MVLYLFHNCIEKSKRELVTQSGSRCSYKWSIVPEPNWFGCYNHLWSSPTIILFNRINLWYLHLSCYAVSFIFSTTAEHFSTRLLILQCVFLVSGAWLQLPSHLRMLFKVWLVCKHPSCLEYNKNILFKKVVCTYVRLLFLPKVCATSNAHMSVQRFLRCAWGTPCKGTL